jgi:hypothetical protein
MGRFPCAERCMEVLAFDARTFALCSDWGVEVHARGRQDARLA